MQTPQTIANTMYHIPIMPSGLTEVMGWFGRLAVSIHSGCTEP